MKCGLVSVVVPVYNVKDFLDRCVESLVSQTYRDIEILLIDDGSTDGCSEICDGWAKKDPRIIAIHKENEGLGMARNTGIDSASGEYICFVDGDDYLVPYAVEKAYEAAVAQNADVVEYGLSCIDPHGRKKKEIVPDSQVFEGGAVTDVFLPDLIAPDPETGEAKPYFMSVCVCLFSTEVLRSSGCRFPSERDIISEDIYFLLGFYKYVNKAVLLPEAMYCYVDNRSSLSRSYTPDRYERIKVFYNECVKLCRKSGYDETVVRRLSGPFLANTLSAMKQEVRSGLPFGERIKTVKKIADDPLMRTVLGKIKHDRMGIQRKILFFAVRHRMYVLTAILLRLKK